MKEGLKGHPFTPMAVEASTKIFYGNKSFAT